MVIKTIPDPTPTTSTKGSSSSAKKMKTSLEGEKSIIPLEESYDEEGNKIPPKKASKSKAKVYADFDETGCHEDLSRDDKHNIVPRKIKISSGCTIESKLIHAAESKLVYDYAALIISRKMKDNKAFSFNMPLNVLVPLVAALNSIKRVNKKFFGPIDQANEQNLTYMVKD